MKLIFRMYLLLVMTFLGQQLYGKYSVGCQWYGDEFGPLQTGYTMGDLVRYTANPGMNIYSKMIVPPAGALDIPKYGKNEYNLYNALGYLYAGWSLFNSSNFDDITKWLTSYRIPQGGAREEFDNNYLCGNTIEFNVTPSYQVVKNSPIGTAYSAAELNSLSANTQGGNDRSLKGLANFNPSGGDSTDAFASLFGHYWCDNCHYDGVPIDNTPTAASASCGWCSNASDGDMMMYFIDPELQQDEQLPIMVFKPNFWSPHYKQGHGIAGGRVYPTGQFFGARIAHILGAVVNDVPWNINDSKKSGSSGGTGRFESPLISGKDNKGTPLPMIAVMSGNNAGWAITGSGATATSTAPAGMFQPSTAHFGSMNSFLNNVKTLEYATIQEKSYYNYLQLHCMPTVKRLSSLCSYALSTHPSELSNLIEIKDSSVTSYDNGIIVSVQNNTGDLLHVYQGASVPENQIGMFNVGNNNYYLYTASLMAGQTAPDQGQMISIMDNSSDTLDGTYIQILSATQLQALYTAMNVPIGNFFGTGDQFNYNQMGLTYTIPTDTTPAYVVVTNFDPTIDSSNNLKITSTWPSSATNQEQTKYQLILNSWRIQAINVAEFYQKPYFLTIQINKEQIGHGVRPEYKQDASENQVLDANGNPIILGYSLSKGSPNAYCLLPSIMSSNIFTWQNYLHSQKNKELQILEHYSHMPILMMPKDILNSKILGLNVYYTIWLMACAAAMTECSYNKAIFGDALSVYNNVFNLFSNFTTPTAHIKNQSDQAVISHVYGNFPTNSDGTLQFWLAVNINEQVHIIFNNPGSGLNMNEYWNAEYESMPLLTLEDLKAGICCSLVQEENAVYVYCQTAKGINLGHTKLNGIFSSPATVIWTGSFLSATKLNFNETFLLTNDPKLQVPSITIPDFLYQYPVVGKSSSELSRVVVDQAGILNSGKTVELDNNIILCGCDTWDSGGGFNQDIPILNFTHGGQDAYGNAIVIPNKIGSDYVNLSITFGDKITVDKISDAVTSFDKAYGNPYSNTMLFSVPTAALKDGIKIEMKQANLGYYQFIITSTKGYVDAYKNTIHSGSVLAVPAVFIDSNIYTGFNKGICQFLRLATDTDWKSSTSINCPSTGEMSSVIIALQGNDLVQKPIVATTPKPVSQQFVKQPKLDTPVKQKLDTSVKPTLKKSVELKEKQLPKKLKSEKLLTKLQTKKTKIVKNNDR